MIERSNACLSGHLQLARNNFEAEQSIIPKSKPRTMSSVTAPAWLQSIPRGTRIAAGATIGLSAILALSRSNQSRTVPGLGAVFGASGDGTVAFPWLVVVPGSVMWL